MDEGVRCLICMIVFCICAIMQIIISSFKIAIDHINDSDLEELQKGDPAKAGCLERYHSDDHLLVISSSFLRIFSGIGIVASSFYLLYNGLSDIAENTWERVLFAILVYVVFVVLYAVFFFGTLYRISSKKHCKIALRYLGAYETLRKVFRPLILLYDLLSKKISGLFGVDPKEEVDDVTEDEIISIVNEGHEHGVLLASEAAMIHNIFEFGDKDAKDIMVHRRQIIALDGEMTFGEALTFMQDAPFSRYPVYLNDLDNIIGLLHIKDALVFAKDHKTYGQKLRDFDKLLHSPEFVPETHSLNTLFAKMQSKKKHMMIVVDEYGQTSGIISMEDILEEIVGNILDEYDAEEEYISALEDGFVLNGMTPLEEVEEALGITFEEEDMDSYDTLNGFLVSRLGHIPKKDEHSDVVYGGYQFHILSMENKTIRSVKATRVPVEKQTEEKEGSLL